MKKRIRAIIMTGLLCFLMVCPVTASEDKPLRVADNADLLTAEEESTLLDKLDEISQRQELDVVVVTSDTLDGKSAEAYADDYYDYNGYGYGDSKDGVLLLVCMEDRDWSISTTGYGITAFTDAGIEYISEEFLPDLSDGEYEMAFETYADQCDDFISQARSGEPYDVGNMPGDDAGPFWFVLPLLIALLLGFLLAFIPMGVMKSKLKTVHKQPKASSYVKKGSKKITEKKDQFLYHTIMKTEIPKDDDKGGSSTHTSSSGTTHGGGSGKF